MISMATRRWRGSCAEYCPRRTQAAHSSSVEIGCRQASRVPRRPRIVRACSRCASSTRATVIDTTELHPTDVAERVAAWLRTTLPLTR